MKSEIPQLKEMIKKIYRKNASRKIPYMERLVDEINKDAEKAKMRPFIFNHNPRVKSEVRAGGDDSLNNVMESSSPLIFIENFFKGIYK
jgi:hypothetical protein